MRTKLGVIFMILGSVLIFGALFLFHSNRKEAAAAQQTSQALLPRIRTEIRKKEASETQPDTYVQPEATPVEFLEPDSIEMTEVIIDGHGYIGTLSIPKLELELPIMADWDYSKLRIAPCRYHGSVRGGDLVLMAHNYAKHFGGIASLTEDDRVIFTDMDGIVTAYRVVGQDILMPDAVEEMTCGEFDLALFTCTYGGQSRVSVYCDRVS